MFDHSSDKIIFIRLNSDGAKGKGGEADGSIDAILCGVYIYRKDRKLTKSGGQCTNSDRGGVTKVAAAGLFILKRQDYVVY